MTHANFPYSNDPEDLIDYMFDMAQDHFKFKKDEKEVREAMLKLIKEVKSEWEKASYGQGWIDGVRSSRNSKLNPI